MSEASSHVPAMFGSMVFNEKVMKERLPKDTYKALKKCKDEGIPLDMSVATVVANAMKDWALEKGATHYTHWFQPMTGVTAEKHDSFISPTDDGRCHYGIFRQGVGTRRAGRFLVPLRRPARNL